MTQQDSLKATPTIASHARRQAMALLAAGGLAALGLPGGAVARKGPAVADPRSRDWRWLAGS